MRASLILEKICSHCGTPLLVGLHYCPGCLHAIERRRGGEHEEMVAVGATEALDDVNVGFGSLFPDLEASWDNLVFPLKAGFCRIFRRPEPPSPQPAPVVYGQEQPRSGSRQAGSMPTLSLSPGYTRLVCPKCRRAQGAPSDLGPADVVTCNSCRHTFPAAFAAEFRKGADLHCQRCGIVSFCVTGLQVTSCPNCRFSTQRATARIRLKPKILATIAALIFLSLFAHAVLTKTTTNFIVGLSIGIVSSIIGFVTLVTLGF